MGGAVTIRPGESLPVVYYVNPPGGGPYVLVPYFMENGVWYRYNAIGGVSPSSVDVDIPDVRLTSEITSSLAQPIPGQTTTITYTVRNFGIQSAVYETSLLQCRLNTSTVCDSPGSAPITLAANEERTFTHALEVTKAGSYKLVPYFLKNGSWYKYSKGAASNNQIVLVVPKYVADLRLTTGIISTPATPSPGQTVTLAYTVRNFGNSPAIYQNSILQCRRDVVANCDFPYGGSIIIAAGASRTFTETMVVPTSGTYSLRPYFMQNETWYGYGPDPLHAWRNMVVPAYLADMRLTTPISASPAIPSIGQTVTVSYTVQNFGDQPAIYQNSVLQCRRNGVVNCDSAFGGNTTIEAGASRTFNHLFQLTSNGIYTFTPYFMQNNNWLQYNAGSAPSNKIFISI